MKVIVISGPIGAGKTTFLNIVKELKQNEKNFTFLQEKDRRFNDQIIQDFYQDPKRYGFEIQVNVYSHFQYITYQMKELQQQKQIEYVIVERSPMDALEFFIQCNKDLYTDAEYNALCSIFAELCQQHVWKNATYLYLKQDPKICLNRIRERRHAGEADHITLDYMQKLHELHENYYAKNKHIQWDEWTSCPLDKTKECAKSMIELLESCSTDV